jgi:hypothetical protein
MKRYLVAKILSVVLMLAFAATALAAESRTDGSGATPAWIDGGGAGGGASGAGVGNF